MAIYVVLSVVIGYLLGALPMGYILIKIFKRQDITQFGSGRTGGTNAMRAGGFGFGVLTALFDFLKGYLSVWIAQRLSPGMYWVHVVAGVASVFGHNWSLWLYWWKRRFTAGAGTGPNVGAAMAFWPGIGLLAVPAIAFCVFVIGYASVASLVTGLVIVGAFVVRYLQLGEPWEYIIYGVITLSGVIWALRPNIQRLIAGTERRVGIFAKKPRHASAENSSG